jgi:hypothetical protein
MIIFNSFSNLCILSLHKSIVIVVVQVVEQNHSHRMLAEMMAEMMAEMKAETMAEMKVGTMAEIHNRLVDSIVYFY